MYIENIDQLQERDFEQLSYTSYLTIADRKATKKQVEEILNKAPQVSTLGFQRMMLEELPANLPSLKKLNSLRIEITTLSNLDVLKKCRELVDFTFLADPLPAITGSAKEDLPKLQNLYLGIKDLTEFPSYFITPTIQSLQIWSDTLNTLPGHVLNKMSALTSMTLDAPLKTLPELQVNNKLTYLSLKNTRIGDWSNPTCWPGSLQTVHITQNKIGGYGPVFSQLPNLRSLHIGTDCQQNWLTGIGSCQKLTDLSISQIDGIPDDLKDCQVLESLSIYKGTITSLSDWFCSLANLRKLSISYTSLKHVPADWSKMTKLESVSLDNNQIEDFHFTFSIPELQGVVISNNPIRDQWFILDAKKALPISMYGSFWSSVFVKGFNLEDKITFYKAIAKSDLDREDKKWFMIEIDQQRVLHVPDVWPIYRMFQGLCIPHKRLLDKLQQKLLDHKLNNDSVKAMQAGKVWLCGDFTEKKTAIKEKLGKIAVPLTTQFDVDVTHIVIGKKPTDLWPVFQDNSYQFLLESQLYQILKEIDSEEKFLVQEEVTGGQQMAAGLRRLLTSKDDSSVLLGLEMLKAGGVPSNIIDELLLVQKTSSDAKVRAEAKKLLLTQGSVEWVQVLNDKQSFTNLETTKEKDVRTKLEKMAKSVSRERVAEFGLLLFSHYQKGLSYILVHFKHGGPQRIKALKALTQGDHFDFHIGVGYNNWKLEKPESVILSPVKTGIKFPFDHPEAAKIRIINLHNTKFATIPKEIAVFENLEELDCSANSLKSLPEEIGKLTKLKRLDLSLNRFDSLPTGILKLTNLEWLDLRYNNDSVFKDGEKSIVKLPENFKELLPNCEVLL
ncbi:hypothetical protein QNI19_18565 [Cytophagaceae bacterium DM2B3-1]|uniref:Disease resistance R13L4/SHOC-2-like LRR domain-containing protein n=1 Tax=Xanthocytophaga flava TaxID=3048013 RepID=A0ABT7CMI0_9BACT|nr:hypothetical protein [Xanthocytophaga flavus]MDJ1494948.1 hypothetical protein [Xanthocytophaga flavus]